MRIRNLERNAENPHIHRLQFEELIYHYDESRNNIMKILGLTEQQHTERLQRFNPEKSIHNTQLFRNPSYAAEVEIIENKLGAYLFDFPYVHKADEQNSF